MHFKPENICVVGLGYIGLPTASILGASGHRVIGYDVKEEKISQLLKGNLPFFEPGLKTLFEGAVNSGNLTFSKTLPSAEAYIICVPTPITEDEKPDMSSLSNATEAVAEKCPEGSLIIIESTVYPGATEEIVIPHFKKRGFIPGKNIFFAHCPERVIPGRIVKELIENDRVIGGFDEKSAQMAKSIYSTFVEGEIFLTDIKTAEMVKVAENTFRMVNIALSMEFALLAEKFGVDVWEVIELANRHPRVKILKPGPGMGGHCLPVDPYFLLIKKINPSIIHSSLEMNKILIEHSANLACEFVKEGERVTVLGVAYKADVDDHRNSPGFAIGKLLEERKISVVYHDPYVRIESVKENLLEAVSGSHLILLTVDHTPYKKLNPEEIGSVMEKKQIVDLRGIINFEEWKKANFRVKVLGRGKEI